MEVTRNAAESATAVPMPRDPAVIEQLAWILKTSQNMQQLIVNIEEKLSPILRPAFELTEEPAIRVQSEVPHAEALRSLGVDLEWIEGRMDSIVNRIEI